MAEQLQALSLGTGISHAGIAAGIPLGWENTTSGSYSVNIAPVSSTYYSGAEIANLT